MQRFFLVLFTSVFCIFLVQCEVKSVQPLAKATESINSQMIGTWVPDHKLHAKKIAAKDYLYIRKLSDKKIELKTEDDIYHAYQTTVGKHTFLNVIKIYTGAAQKQKHFSFVWVRVEEGVITFRMLKTDFFRQAVKNKRLKGTLGKGKADPVYLQASGKQIQRFILKYGIDKVLETNSVSAIKQS